MKGTFNAMKKHVMKRILCALLSILTVTTTFAFLPIGAASAAWDGTTETYDWYVAAEGTAKDPYILSKPSDLAGWSALSNGTYNYQTLNALTGFTENSAIHKKFDGKYFRLSASLDMGGHNFEPIFAANSFNEGAAGIFGEIHLDGQNHTVKNLKITDVGSTVRSHAALFSCLGAGSEIRNLHFENAEIKGSRAAVIAAESSTQDMTVYNVSVDSTSSVTGTTWAGGLFCLMLDTRAAGKSSSFSYCVNAATVTGTNRMGGIVASYQTSDDVTFSYCVNKGALITQSGSYIGGILGTTMDGIAKGMNVKMENCYNTGTITVNSGSSRISGLLADHRGHANHTFTAVSCYDASNRSISGTTYHSAMGIAVGSGAATAPKTLEYCYAVKGTLSGTAYADTVGSPLKAAANTTLGTSVTSSLLVASTTTSITLKDGTTSTVVREMARIDTAIASLRNVEFTLYGDRLSLRIGLDTPYRFMTITKITNGKGNSIACEEFGFAYSTDRKEARAIFEEENAKVVGEAYTPNGENTGKFSAYYTNIGVADLDTTVYVVAYAKVGGAILLSEVREINLYEVTDAIVGGAYSTVNFPETEKNVYEYMSMACVQENERLDSAAGISKWLKVATYNVYHCADARLFKNDNSDPWNANIVNTDNIGDFMLAYDLDVLTMNETTRYSIPYRDNRTAQAERVANYLTQKTGKQYYWAFANGKTDSKGEFGNAIVSKYPIKNVTNGTLNDVTIYDTSVIVGSDHARSLGHAELNVNGQTVSVLFTHFGLSDAVRTNSVATVKQKVQSIKAADTNRPIIFMGDLNEDPYAANGMYNTLLTFLEPTAPKNELPLTYSNLRPATTIDYIMHSSNVVSKDLYVPADVLYSDHLPVIATIGLPKQ